MKFDSKSVALSFLIGTFFLAGSAMAAEVYFISPADEDVSGAEVLVQFGLKGMGVTVAGNDAPNTGHHHLLIDIENLPALNMPLPNTEQVRHFGGGQTETVIQLSPGTHTLQLVFGNFLHIPHDPPLISKKITVEIRAE